MEDLRSRSRPSWEVVFYLDSLPRVTPVMWAIRFGRTCFGQGMRTQAYWFCCRLWASCWRMLRNCCEGCFSSLASVYPARRCGCRSDTSSPSPGRRRHEPTGSSRSSIWAPPPDCDLCPGAWRWVDTNPGGRCGPLAESLSYRAQLTAIRLEMRVMNERRVCNHDRGFKTSAMRNLEYLNLRMDSSM
jgi:hypothetical protein